MNSPMIRNFSQFLFVSILAGALVGSLAFAEPSVATAVPKGKLEAFLKDYCIDCHGPDRQKGQVRFDEAEWVIDNIDTAQRWQDVLDQLNGGDMPPEEETQPTSEELASVLDALTGSVLEAQRRLTDHGGEIKMRRLNRREYARTIYDLFGFDVSLDEIPEDGEIATFDTVGEEQFFTSAHFEKYLNLGKRIVHEAFGYNTRPRNEATIERSEPEEKFNGPLREKLADLDRKMELKKAGADWKEMGFKDEGEMEIIFRQWDSRAELPRRYLQLPKIEEGVYISTVSKWVSMARHTDIRADYIVRIHGGIVGEPDDIRKIVKLSDRDGIKGTLKIAGTLENPESVELRTRQRLGQSQLGVRVIENMPDYTANSTRGYRQRLQGAEKLYDPWGSIWIDWLEIEGPFYPEGRPKFEDLLYPGLPTGKGSPYIWNDAKAPELIEKFAFEAFRRRQPEPEFLSGLQALYQENRTAGLSQRESMEEVMGVILASPAFLFLREDAPAQKKKELLDSRELAIRLSYFLWSCPPDEALYAADLTDLEILSQQIDRMLASPKAEAFRDGFMAQWGEMDRFDAITVNERDFHRFNAGVRHSAKQEVYEFFGSLIEENLPASHLIDSDFVMINPALAIHYGIDGLSGNGVDPKNDEFQKVVLPAESQRGGLMTQTAFLMTGSNGERSSPVIRGALVMEKLLHDEPAPPPPNVPELGSSADTPRTNRELVQLHQEQAVCASCHKKMDVIGFGLENFDPVGMWRDTEKVGRKQVPIEPGGTLPDGAVFSNVQELKTVLIKHEEDLAHQLVESILAYALGRTIEFSDADDVADLLAALKSDDYRVRSMIREVAMSPLFRSK